MSEVEQLHVRIKRITNRINRTNDKERKRNLIDKRKKLAKRIQKINMDLKNQLEKTDKYINNIGLNLVLNRKPKKMLIREVRRKIKNIQSIRKKRILLNFLKKIVEDKDNSYMIESLNDLFKNYSLLNQQILPINLYLQALLNLSIIISRKQVQLEYKTVAYIIPYRHSDIYRFINLLIIIWHTLSNFNYIKIYITEQDSESKLKKFTIFNELVNNGLVTHNFLFRDIEGIDRGNIFNCTIKHFLGNEDIVIMGDCDMPLMGNIPSLIRLIRSKKAHFVSPYTYLSKLEKNKTMKFLKMEHIQYGETSNLFTFSGGILIVDKNEFIKLGMWFEYNNYGNEDRTLDVILEKLRNNKCYQSNSTRYIHLWHPKGIRVTQDKDYLGRTFGCKYSLNRKSMHDKCGHKSPLKWYKIYKKQNKGSLYKYKNKIEI